MRIEIDLSAVPPLVTLAEPDIFTALEVVVEDASHAFISRDALVALAGSRADDPQWCRQLDGMLDYALERGWARDDGAVRAHIERRSAQ